MKKFIFLIIMIFAVGLYSCGDDPVVEKESYDVFAHVQDNMEYYQVKSGEAFQFIGIVPSGYAIDGWYADEAFSTPYDISSIHEDVDIYAHLVKNQYTATFYDFSGEVLKTTKCSKGSSFTTPIERPTKLYREFTYWCLDEALTKPYDFSSIPSEDMSFYPAYKEVTYEDILDTYVPDVVDRDINIVQDNVDLMYSFESSKPTIISNQGTYLPSREEEDVEVKLTIRCDEDSVTYSKHVKVVPYKLAEIELGDLVVGYASQWYYDNFSEEILKTCNVINISFAYVNSNGTLDTNALSSFRNAITICHQNNVRVLLSIQGGESNNGTRGFSDCAADPALRKTLADNMAKACVEYHFDGIDIDWEYPGSYKFGNRQNVDKYNFTFLMEDIRSSLDKLGGEYLLTSAIPGGSWGAGNFELTKVAAIFDYINIMTYDLEGSSVLNHHSPLKNSPGRGVTDGASIEETVEMWHNTHNVPYEKMVIGCAFYSKTADGSPSPSYDTMLAMVLKQKVGNERYTILHEKFIDRLGEGHNFHYVFDEGAYAPYIYSKFATSGRFFTYDNERSLVAKAEFAREKGLGGVMIWELGEDKTNYLITAVAQGMDRHLDGKYYVVEGTINLSAGQTITVKTIEEVVASSLKDNLIYEIDSTSCASLDGDKLTLYKAGQVIVTAKSTDGTIYGSLTVVIE